MGGNENQLLYDSARGYGVELSQHQLSLFAIYLDELWDWNQRMNLTGLSTRESITIELFLDSLIPAPFLPERGRMLDVGSGAGFPGLPLKIYSPQLKTHLLEANSKKVSFLKQVARLLTLNEIEVIQGRIEKDEGKLHGGDYQLITARALAGLRQTILWCSPFLSRGGLMVGFLGSRVDDEIEESRQIMEQQQIILQRVISYVLPGKKTRRHTLILKRQRMNSPDLLNPS